MVAKEWKKVNLGKKCQFERGVEPGSSNYNTSGRGDRFIRVSDLTNSKEDAIFTDIKSDKFLKKGDISISLDGTVGVVRDDIEGIYSTGIRKVNFSDREFCRKFIYYLLKSDKVQRIIENNSSGSTIIHAGKAVNFFDVEIPELIQEQQKIAEILNKVDEAIDATKKNIKKNERIKKGLMQDLFSKGVDEKGNLRSEETHEFKDSELGRIPKEWEVVKIHPDAASIITGNKDTQDKKENGEYPFFVRSQKVEKINSYSYDGEAILTSGDGVGVGKIYHYVNCKFDFHQRVYMIHNFNKDISGKFLFYYFKAHFYDQVALYSAKTTVDSVRLHMIADMKLPKPRFIEQQKIVSILSLIDVKIQKEKKELNKLKKIKEGLMQDLLAGKVRVNHLIQNN